MTSDLLLGSQCLKKGLLGKNWKAGSGLAEADESDGRYDIGRVVPPCRIGAFSSWAAAADVIAGGGSPPVDILHPRIRYYTLRLAKSDVFTPKLWEAKWLVDEVTMTT